VIDSLSPLPKNKDNDMHRATPISIDKVILSIGDFRVKPNNLLSINTTQKPTGETYIKRFCNQSGVVIDIKPQRQSGLDNCYIGFNPNKTAISDIQDIISDSGVILKLDEGKLIRLDLCRDMELHRNTMEYHQVLRHSMNPRLNFAQSYDTARIHPKTKTYEIGFYNKSREANLSISGIHRLEARLLRHKSISEFGLTTYSDIVNMSSTDMLSIYRKIGKRCLPNLYSIPDNTTVITYLSSIIEKLYEDDSRPVSNFFKLVGLVGNFDADVISTAINCADIGKYKRRDMRKHHKEMMMKLEKLNIQPSLIREEIISYFAAA